MHQLRVRSQGSLLVASGQWAATPQRCQEGYRELREAHDRTTARWPAAPWMLARASAKRMRCQGGSTRETLGCEQLTFNWELQGSGATELGTGNCGFAAPRVAQPCSLLML